MTDDNGINPKGISNHGNMCFMNSIVQCLLHIPSFRSLLKMEIDGPYFDAFRKTLKAMNNSRVKICDPYVYNLLTDTHRQQQDAQEYLEKIIESLEKEASANESKGEDTKDGWIQVSTRKTAKKRVNNRKYTISTLFKGINHVTVTFSSGKKNSTTLQPFQSMPIDVKCNSTLEGALDKMSKAEIVSDCNDESQLISKFDNLPLIMMFQLKKFYWTNGRAVKIDRNFEFPDTLEINQQWMSKTLRSNSIHNIKYRLRSIIHHHGKGAGRGHYDASVMIKEAHRSDNTPGEWYLLDDENYIKSKKSSKNSYLLFYEMIE